MTINEYFQKNVVIDNDRYVMCPQLTCIDGFKMSVQASEFHYCSPRETGLSEYISFEVGFPNRKEELLKEFAEEPKRLTKTVYGWVPANVIDEVIKKHGGVKC